MGRSNGASSAFNRILRTNTKTSSNSIPTDAKSVTNTILSHLAAGRLRKAVSLLFSSPFPFPYPIYSQFFHHCATSRAVVEARKVESHLVTYLHPPLTFLLNRVIETYGKCGCLRDAQVVFDDMPQRDGGSWNAMITACSQGGAPGKALGLFLDMNRFGVWPSEVTIASVLGCCGSLLELEFSRMVHGVVMKRGFSENVILGSALVDVYGKCGVMDDARRVFDDIKNPNAVSWNVIVRRYLKIGYERKAISMFFQSIRAGLRPLTFTFSNVLVACSNIKALLEGVTMHCLAIKFRCEDDDTVSASLIDMYVNCGDLENAMRIFDRLSNKNVISSTSMISGFAMSGKIQEAREVFDKMPDRNIITWNAMLAGYVRSSLWKEAFQLISLMRREIVAFDNVTLNYMLSVCSALSEVVLGKQVHAYIYRHGFHSDLSVSNSLIDLYGKGGSLRSAEILFHQMSGWRDMISWNSMMAALARHRMSEEVLTMFPNMLMETSPNKYTITTLLSACANTFALIQGKEIHGFMMRNDYEIDDVVLGAMVDMYSKCRYFEYALQAFRIAKPGDVVLWNSIILGCCYHGVASQALELFELMKEVGIKPDYVTFQAVLRACICGGYVDQGKKYFDAMSTSYCVTVRFEHYECMIELYCRYGAMHELNEFMSALPFEPTMPILTRVLDACREFGNPRLEKWAAKQLDKLNHSDY